MSASASSAFHLVIPAAGIGSRFGADKPKQYCEIQHKPLIHHAMESCVAAGGCQSITVALAEDDRHWAPNLSLMPQQRVLGGAERSDSVLAALNVLVSNGVGAEDWVLVHDAARPYVPLIDMQNLLLNANTAAGALLAAPVADTIKRVRDGKVTETVDRSSLWRALTPQAFQLGCLIEALQYCGSQQISVTDEASAMQALGMEPLVVQGSAANIKVTLPEDLHTVANFLAKNPNKHGNDHD